MIRKSLSKAERAILDEMAEEYAAKPELNKGLNNQSLNAFVKAAVMVLFLAWWVIQIYIYYHLTR